jgi:hypothetical protein
MHFVSTTNLHVSICEGYNSRQLMNYAINIYYDVNDINLLNLFHHLRLQFCNYLAYNFDSWKLVIEIGLEYMYKTFC